MKIFKVILSLFAAAFIFVGAVGVDVFSHTCEVDGTFVSVIFEPSDEHCGDHQQELPPCCEVEKNSHTTDDDCCDDTVDRFQVKIDFSQEITHFQLIGAVIPSFDVFFPESDKFSDEDLTTAGLRAPPPLIGRDYQIIYESWLI